MTNNRLKEMAEINKLDGYEKIDLYNYNSYSNH